MTASVRAPRGSYQRRNPGGGPQPADSERASARTLCRSGTGPSPSPSAGGNSSREAASARWAATPDHRATQAVIAAGLEGAGDRLGPCRASKRRSCIVSVPNLPPAANLDADNDEAAPPGACELRVGLMSLAARCSMTAQPGSTSARGWASPSRVRGDTIVASRAGRDPCQRGRPFARQPRCAVHRLPAHRRSCLRAGCCGRPSRQPPGRREQQRARGARRGWPGVPPELPPVLKATVAGPANPAESVGPTTEFFLDALTDIPIGRWKAMLDLPEYKTITGQPWETALSCLYQSFTTWRRQFVAVCQMVSGLFARCAWQVAPGSRREVQRLGVAIGA